MPRKRIPKPTQELQGLPKIRGTFLGVPIIRTVVFLGLYWGHPTLGNYQYRVANWGSSF